MVASASKDPLAQLTAALAARAFVGQPVNSEFPLKNNTTGVFPVTEIYTFPPGSIVFAFDKTVAKGLQRANQTNLDQENILLCAIKSFGGAMDTAYASKNKVFFNPAQNMVVVHRYFPGEQVGPVVHEFTPAEFLNGINSYCGTPLCPAAVSASAPAITQETLEA